MCSQQDRAVDMTLGILRLIHEKNHTDGSHKHFVEAYCYLTLRLHQQMELAGSTLHPFRYWRMLV
jgi:hypothetical protein